MVRHKKKVVRKYGSRRTRFEKMLGVPCMVVRRKGLAYLVWVADRDYHEAVANWESGCYQNYIHIDMAPSDWQYGC